MKQKKQEKMSGADAEIQNYKSMQRHKSLARETRERMKRISLKDKEIANAQRQYEIDNLHVYHLNRKAMESVSSGMGVSQSSLQLPRRLLPRPRSM